MTDVAGNPTYIVIEGPIGVGKTTLAKRLASSFGTQLMLEGADENPFLARFYKDPAQAALPTQLFFLFQRVKQMQALAQGDLFRSVHVADFLMEKDRLFARMILDEDELTLYEQVYEHTVKNVRQPDLVIYLQSPVAVLLERISKRNRAYERHIDSCYLQQLIDAYTKFFYQYEAAPLLMVNASEIDLVNNEKDYDMLLEQVKTIRSGRHFFNPLPFDLT